MTGAVRAISLCVVGGVTLFHALSSRMWSAGWGVLLSAMLIWSGAYWLIRASNTERSLGKTIVSALPRISIFLAASYLLLQLSSALIALMSGTPLGRVAGLAPHANVAGSTVLAFWVLLLVSSRAQPMSHRLVTLITGVGSLVALLLILAAGTRSVLLGVIVGILLAQAVTPRSMEGARRWYGAVIVLGSLTMTLVTVAILRSDLTSVFGSFERGPIHLTALQIASLSPWVGLGDGAWEIWSVVLEPSLPPADATHSHNVYLYLMLGGGAFGLAAVLVLLSEAVGSLLANASNNRSKLIFLAAIVALALQGMVDVTVVYPAVYSPLLLAAAVMGVDKSRTTEKGRQSYACK